MNLKNIERQESFRNLNIKKPHTKSIVLGQLEKKYFYLITMACKLNGRSVSFAGVTKPPSITS